MLIAFCSLVASISATSERPLKRQKEDHDDPISDFVPVPQSIDQISRAVAESYPILDWANDEFKPFLEHDATWEWTPQGLLFIDEVIARNSRRILFSLENNTDFLIMYVHNCDVSESRYRVGHPRTSPTEHSQITSLIPTGAEVIYMSPSTPLMESPKTSFEISPRDFAHCMTRGANVRYVVIKPAPRGGAIPLGDIAKTLHTRAAPHKAYGRIFELGARLIDAIRSLHERGIVQGQLSSDSTVLQRVGKDSIKMFFRFNSTWGGPVDPVTGLMLHTRPVMHMSLTEKLWMSPWEIRDGEGHIYSKMDDFHRAVETIAFLVNNHSFDPRIDFLERGVLLAFKTYGSLFDLDVSNRLGIMNPTIPGLLVHIQSLARTHSNPPPYEEMKSLLMQISTALEAVVPPSFE